MPKGKRTREEKLARRNKHSQGQSSPSVTVTEISVHGSTPSTPTSSLKTGTSKNPKNEILAYLEKKEFIKACLENKTEIIKHLQEQIELLVLYDEQSGIIKSYKEKLKPLLNKLETAEFSTEEQNPSFINSMKDFINYSYDQLEQYREKYGIDLSNVQLQIKNLEDILYIYSSMLTNIYFCEFLKINISNEYKSQNQDILGRNYSLELLLLNYFLEHILDSEHQTIKDTDLSSLAIIIRNKISQVSKLKILDIKIFSKYKEYFESLNESLCKIQNANDLNNFFQTYIFKILPRLIKFKPLIKLKLSEQINPIQQQLSKIESQQEANQQLGMVEESLNSPSLTIEQMTQFAEKVLKYETIIAFYSDCQTLKKKITDLPQDLSEKLTELNKKILEINIVDILDKEATLNTEFKLLIVDALLPKINKLKQTQTQSTLNGILTDFNANLLAWQCNDSFPKTPETNGLVSNIFETIQEIQKNEKISLSDFFDKINSIRENYNQISQKQKELEEKKKQKEEKKKQEEEKKRQEEEKKKRQKERERKEREEQEKREREREKKLQEEAEAKRKEEEKRRQQAVEEEKKRQEEAEKKRQEEEKKRQEEREKKERERKEAEKRLTEENENLKKQIKEMNKIIQTQATNIQELTQNIIAEQKERLSELFQKFIIDPDKYEKTRLENSEQISDLISTIIKHPINETTIDCLLQFMTLYINEPLQIQQKILEYKQNPQNKKNYESFLKFIELFKEIKLEEQQKFLYIFNAGLLYDWLQDLQKTYQTVQLPSPQTPLDSTYELVAPAQQPISERVLQATTQNETVPAAATTPSRHEIQIFRRGQQPHITSQTTTPSQTPTTLQENPNVRDFGEFSPL